MEFNKKIETLQNALFSEYERNDKITKEDWKDEAQEMAFLISNTGDNQKVFKTYSEYLEEKFVDDKETDFYSLTNRIMKKMV